MSRVLLKLTGGKEIPDAFMRFMRMNACFLAILQINNVFINTFLMKASGDTLQVMYFNIILGVVQPFAMILAVQTVKRFSVIRSQQIGLALYSAVYLFFILFIDSAANYRFVLSALLSVAAGFYFTSYMAELVAYTRDEIKDASYGVIGMITGGIQIAVPLLSGLLVSALKGLSGYRLLFIIGFLISLLSLFLSTKLSEIERSKPASLLYITKVILSSKRAFGAMGIAFISGVRGGTMTFFLNILLYSLISSEALIGFNTFLGGLAFVFMSSMYARHISSDKRYATMFMALSMLATFTAGLYFKLSPLLIILYNIVNCGLNAFVDNPPLIAYFTVINSMDELAGQGSQVHAVREFFVGAGKATGILIAILLPKTSVGSITVLLIICVFQFFNAALASYVSKSSIHAQSA